MTELSSAKPAIDDHAHVRRFHLPHAHLDSVFGGDWFALKAEAFARFFGTPLFLVMQTIIVAVWIIVNVAGWTSFDIYPFILLNLAFSLQAAYAAPLILLAQTRQADRDKANGIADAQHREELHQIADARQLQMEKQTELLVEMLKQNNALTEQVSALLAQNTALTDNVKGLVERINALTTEVHSHVIPKGDGVAVLASRPAIAQRLDQQGEGLRRLAAAWVIQVVARKRRAPIRKRAHETAAFEIAAHLLFREVGKAEPGARRREDQRGAAEHKLAVDARVHFAAVLFELPGVKARRASAGAD